MKQYCNLCGKKVRFFKKCLEHGQSRFHMCRGCFGSLSALLDQEAHERAKKYLEEKMARGRNERMNFIIQSKIQNVDLSQLRGKKHEMEKEEENTLVAIIQSAGVFGGGVLFLLGICMLNIHLKMAAAVLAAAVFFGVILYGTGYLVALIMYLMNHKK